MSFCHSRLREIEEQVGMIADTKAYQEDFDLDEEVNLRQLDAAFIPHSVDQLNSHNVSRQLLNIKSSTKELNQHEEEDE